VQDYQALNAITVKNKYPFSLISELINKLQGAKYFTKLDVRWGFNNVHMKEGDKWRAAFWTNRRLYKPLVMFFGLTNSPATFQTMMDGVFEELIMEGVVVVYLDDILIFTKTLEEHQEVVHKVVALLQLHNLSLKPEKCEFEKTSVKYLGVVISQDSVMMDPAKVARVSEWPTPTTKKEVQSFLGFVNFYRRFIEGFSHLARPLFNLTKNSAGPLMNNLPSTYSKRRSLLHPYLPFLTTPSSFVLKRIVLILQLEQSYLSQTQTTANGIL
jgi:Reverse transcriptase (RNA-dependent DNA polymerase)